jgi:hypothetical protein
VLVQNETEEWLNSSVYKFTIDEKEVELSQRELLEKFIELQIIEKWYKVIDL